MENDKKATRVNNKPLWIKNEYSQYCHYEKLLYNTYKKDEIIVFFDEVPTREQLEEVKKSFGEYGFKKVTHKTCDNCEIPVFLFQAKNIHTVINTDPVISGPGTKTKVVGESYSLNFYNNIPFDKRRKTGKYEYRQEGINKKKNKIVVAVLDTGIDTNLVEPGYLWEGTGNPADSNCYSNVSTGWNFIDDNANFKDDNPNRHGSIVSQYIINEFKNSPENYVQIMPLKTHDKEGTGDLFGVICAIHFAIAKGANIINASWGFYFYYEVPMPYLQRLITVTLKEKGILFITASGNKVEQEEITANSIYFAQHHVNLTPDQLRNIAMHNFYPAYLSNDENSVITVTTTDGKIVSARQNYSNKYADLGVVADKMGKRGIAMQFKVPFAGSTDMISGSSFATAIASGIIGAFYKNGPYAPGINKPDVLNFLHSIGGTNGLPKILFTENSLADKYIKKGVFTKKLS